MQSNGRKLADCQNLYSTITFLITYLHSFAVLEQFFSCGFSVTALHLHTDQLENKEPVNKALDSTKAHV